MLVEDGKLKLDDPVALYIPEMGRMKVIGQAAPAARVITVRDLMRHTAGLDYEFIAPQSERSRMVVDARRKGPRDPSNAEYARLLAEVPLAAEPGTVWNYSSATDVLGRVVEVASGKTLAAFMAERVFTPLDMRDTGFYFTDAARQARMAEPATNDRKIAGVYDMFNPRVERRSEFGGEGLVSTARDYARFLQMLVNGGQLDGRRLLRAESVAEMTSDQLGAISRGPAYGAGPAYAFGLGVAVRTAGRDAQPAGEPGDWWWGGAGGTFFWVDPKNQMFAILMMQSPAMRLPYRPMMRQMVYDAMQR
jgi:CubicO group peptidase (beta-lactamase class C family)